MMPKIMAVPSSFTDIEKIDTINVEISAINAIYDIIFSILLFFI